MAIGLGASSTPVDKTRVMTPGPLADIASTPPTSPTPPIGIDPDRLGLAIAEAKAENTRVVLDVVDASLTRSRELRERAQAREAERSREQAEVEAARAERERTLAEQAEARAALERALEEQALRSLDVRG